MRITIEVPEVDRVSEHEILVNGWNFDVREGPVTAEDVAAFAAAKAWFEQHPEVVPDGEG